MALLSHSLIERFLVLHLSGIVDRAAICKLIWESPSIQTKRITL
jgi:DNA-binding SARP family transcriptional activator